MRGLVKQVQLFIVEDKMAEHQGQPQPTPPANTPEQQRVALVMGGVVIGILIACVFSLFTEKLPRFWTWSFGPLAAGC